MLSGLRIEELQTGEGTVAGRGARVTVRYSGYLNRGDPLPTDVGATFAEGERNTIAGLSWGVEGMRVGGRRRLRVGPPVQVQPPPVGEQQTGRPLQGRSQHEPRLGVVRALQQPDRKSVV